MIVRWGVSHIIESQNKNKIIDITLLCFWVQIN